MSHHRFGLPEHFAIDIDVEPDEHALGAAFLAMIAGGLRFGATDRTEQLATFLMALERFRAALPPAPIEFRERSASAVFDEVKSLLTDPDPGRPDFPWELSDRYGKLQLSPNGCSSFDGDWAILLREPDRQRLLMRPFQHDELREVSLAPGVIEDVIGSVLRHPWKGR